MLVVAVVLVAGGLALVAAVRASLHDGVEVAAEQRASELVDQIGSTGLPTSGVAEEPEEEPEPDEEPEAEEDAEPAVEEARPPALLRTSGRGVARSRRPADQPPKPPSDNKSTKKAKANRG